MYYGVVFSQCVEAVALKYFNDYDNLFDGCWFENSAIYSVVDPISVDCLSHRECYVALQMVLVFAPP